MVIYVDRMYRYLSEYFLGSKKKRYQHRHGDISIVICHSQSSRDARDRVMIA